MGVGSFFAAGNGYAGGNGGNGGNGGQATGAGVNCTAALSITSSTISGNIATAAHGGNGAVGGKGGNGGAGGTYKNNGTTYLFIAGTGANGGNGGNGGTDGLAAGGGVYCNNYLTIGTSTVSGNTATAAKAGLLAAGGAKGTGYLGGGTAGAAGTSTYLGGRGGGIDSEMGTIVLTQSTITKNTALNGGGVSVYNDTSGAIDNCTIAANKALTTGGGLFVSLDPANDPINVVSSIIATNTAKIGQAQDLSGEVTAAFTLILSPAGAIVDTDANTDPNFLAESTHLAYVGTTLAIHDHGLTDTLLATINTPVVVNSAYSNPYGFTTDQNGVTISSNNFFIGAVNTTT
jgi:hypothetical protein